MEKTKFKFTPKILATAALFSATSIVCGKFLAFNLGDTIRFSFENLPIILSGIFFGPYVGALTGLTADIIGCILRGYSLNPVLTLAAIVIGLLSGLIYKILKSRNMYLSVGIAVFASHMIGSVLIKTVGLCLWFGSPLYLTLFQRTLNYILVAVAEYIIILLLLKNKTLLNQVSRITR